MKRLKLFEAFIDALKFVNNGRRGECNLYQIWAKLGGIFSFSGREINLLDFTKVGIRRPLIPVAINQEFDNKMCVLDSIYISGSNLFGRVIIDSADGKKIESFPLELINIDRSEEYLYMVSKLD
jgi:hypothetical protein